MLKADRQEVVDWKTAVHINNTMIHFNTRIQTFMHIKPNMFSINAITSYKPPYVFSPFRDSYRLTRRHVVICFNCNTGGHRNPNTANSFCDTQNKASCSHCSCNLSSSKPWKVCVTVRQNPANQTHFFAGHSSWCLATLPLWYRGWHPYTHDIHTLCVYSDRTTGTLTDVAGNKTLIHMMVILVWAGHTADWGSSEWSQNRHKFLEHS